MRCGLDTRTHRENVEQHVRERVKCTLHLELQLLQELLLQAWLVWELLVAGAFLALKFSSTCPFSCAITESIKHLFETPWTSADTHTVVG